LQPASPTISEIDANNFRIIFGSWVGYGQSTVYVVGIQAAQQFSLPAGVSRQGFDRLNRQSDNQAGVDDTWEQDSAEALKTV
jgi:hypothetical protein